MSTKSVSRTKKSVLESAINVSGAKGMYVSEVLKILDGALRHNPQQSARYADLLASKLEADGLPREARLIRDRLALVPRPGVGVAPSSLPVERESQLALVDEESVSLDLPPVFEPSVEARLAEFIESVQRFDELRLAGVAIAPRLLFFGPPGCGKTLGARYLADELQLPLLTVRCDTLVSSLLGQTGKNLRVVFDHAASRPCVLFLDEFDALAKSRSSEGDVGELQRVVIALLQNLDALPSETVVIAATNHAELLDRAVWRRFAFLCQLGLPSEALREKMWSRWLGSYLPEGDEVEYLVRNSEGMSAAAIQAACYDILRKVVLSRRNNLTLPEALRSLFRIRRLATSVGDMSIEEEIRQLRRAEPKVFTWRTIEDTFALSARQVRKVLGEGDERSGEAHHSSAGDAS
ncbi:AAA family ATPase [Lysobacter soli]|uniref:AAA family ATPase n=1 Tax=Lysobacter soli TaxID=453783 RepID=UPI0018DB5933|nr:ATP-binding protein [Lysobacter soli]